MKTLKYRLNNGTEVETYITNDELAEWIARDIMRLFEGAKEAVIFHIANFLTRRYDEELLEQMVES